MDNMEIYYNMNNNIIKNYDKIYKNYEILINIENIDNYNEIIIKDINEILNENKIENKIKYLYNIYDKMITKDQSFHTKKKVNPNKVIQKRKKFNYNSEKKDYEKINIKEEKPTEEDDLKLKLDCSLIKARGLQNVGATCYMNATLQCLYHIKQLSEALVNDDKIDEKLELTYSFKKLIEELAFYNIRKFKNNRLYNRITGENINFIKPENFKEILIKKNPLFKGILAIDSNDLIIYLLEQMDKELTLRNNNQDKMEMFIGNSESEMEKENFKKFHNSIFCDLFYGFQKNNFDMQFL